MKMLFPILATFMLASCDTANNIIDDIYSSSEGTASSSSGFEEEEFPQWDERVVAYSEGEYNEPRGVITDLNTLKNMFKIALNDKSINDKCDYFAISIPITEGLTYLTVSEDGAGGLTIYHIYPNAVQDSLGLCRYPAIISSHRVLVCDKQGGLKDSIKLPPIKFNDPSWDCGVTRPIQFF